MIFSVESYFWLVLFIDSGLTGNGTRVCPDEPTIQQFSEAETVCDRCHCRAVCRLVGTRQVTSDIFSKGDAFEACGLHLCLFLFFHLFPFHLNVSMSYTIAVKFCKCHVVPYLI